LTYLKPGKLVITILPNRVSNAHVTRNFFFATTVPFLNMTIQALLKNRERSSYLFEQGLSSHYVVSNSMRVKLRSLSLQSFRHNTRRKARWNNYTAGSPLSKSQTYVTIPAVSPTTSGEKNPLLITILRTDSIPDEEEIIDRFLRREKKVLLNQQQQLKGLVDLKRH
jgi:hypothetical protein